MNAVKTHAILVLDDGETWSGVDGATICIISDEDLERLNIDEMSVSELAPIFELGLRDYTPHMEIAPDEC